MKTTLDLDDDLLARARQAALDRNTTLRAIVEEALARALGAAVAIDAPVRTVVWPSRPGTRRIAAGQVDAAIRRERDAPSDDPARVARRLGTGRTASPRGRR